MLKKIHLAGVIGALTTLAGILALPEVTAILPGKYATIIIAVGAVIQSVTRGVHKGDVVERPKY